MASFIETSSGVLKLGFSIRLTLTSSARIWEVSAASFESASALVVAAIVESNFLAAIIFFIGWNFIKSHSIGLFFLIYKQNVFVQLLRQCLLSCNAWIM